MTDCAAGRWTLSCFSPHTGALRTASQVAWSTGKLVHGPGCLYCASTPIYHFCIAFCLIPTFCPPPECCLNTTKATQLSVSRKMKHQQTNKNTMRSDILEFPGGRVVKDPALSLLWHSFDPWPGTFPVPWGRVKGLPKQRQ